MKTYHKIQSIYKRDPATKYKTFLKGEFSVDAFDALKDMMWDFTEKVDGTNIRVNWDGKGVLFGGRSDNAQIPAVLLDHLFKKFTPNLLSEKLLGPITLIGEGYGGKIQKGSGYRPDQAFILFDAFVEPNENHPLGIWLERGAVEDIAGLLDIPCVPIVHRAKLLDGVEIIRQFQPLSQVAEDPKLVMEGFVARPICELRDRFGSRVITKVKVRDFPR